MLSIDPFRFASSLHTFIRIFGYLCAIELSIDDDRVHGGSRPSRSLSTISNYSNYLTNVWSFLVSWLITQEAVSSLNIIKSGCTNVKRHVKSFWDASYHFPLIFYWFSSSHWSFGYPIYCFAASRVDDLSKRCFRRWQSPHSLHRERLLITTCVRM